MRREKAATGVRLRCLHKACLRPRLAGWKRLLPAAMILGNPRVVTDESGQAPAWRLRAGFLAALLAVTVLVYQLDLFWRVDLAIFDTALPTGPAPADVVIVAIDDSSIAQLGRWPWPRAVHAALLDRLREAGARAVALDILFTEPESASGAGDIALATAMRRGPPTVVPLLADLPGSGQRPRERLPIPVVAEAAAAIGHAHLELDPDSIVRSVYLREEHWCTHERLPDARSAQSCANCGAASTPRRTLSGRSLHNTLRRGSATTGCSFHFSIRQGTSPICHTSTCSEDMNPALLREKLVLVGMTAQGLGDAFATSRSGRSRPMSGVEIGANILQAVRSGTEIRRVSLPITLLLGVLPVAVAALGLQRSHRTVVAVYVVALGAHARGRRRIASIRGLVVAADGRTRRTADCISVVELAAPGSHTSLSRRRAATAQSRKLSAARQRAGRRANRALRRFRSAPHRPAPRGDPASPRRAAFVRSHDPRAARCRRARRRSGPDRVAEILRHADCSAPRMAGHSKHCPSMSCSRSRVSDPRLQFSLLEGAGSCTLEVELNGTGGHVLVRAVPFHDELGARVGTLIALAGHHRACAPLRTSARRFCASCHTT